MKNRMTTESRAITIADRLSGPALAVLGFINVMFVTITLLLAMTLQGKAAQTDACAGSDIIAELKASSPDVLAAMEAEAAKTAFGEGRLFRIEKPGVAPSWLFGTMHMTDPRVIDLPPAADAAYNASRVVAIESTEILDPAKAQMALLSKPELTMFTGAERLTDYLDEADRAVLQEGLARRGMQLALIERMKPWLVAGMVALPQCEFARKQNGEAFLDLALAQSAERDGKKLVGLETLIEQFEAIASLPMEFHVRGLVEAVELGDRMDDVTETMIRLYVEGKTGLVWPLLRHVSPEEVGKEGEGYADFEEAMVHARNRVMLERSLALVEEGGAFIAVGALHVPGEQGLARLYEKAGYTVTVAD